MLNAAGIIFRSPSGRVLLLRRSDTEDWDYPGGKCKGDESPKEAAVREAFEETKYRAGHAGNFLCRRVRNGVDYTTFLHECEDEFTPKLSKEHTDYMWVTPRTVLSDSIKARNDAFGGGFEEHKHPRGQPENKGQFGPGGGGGEEPEQAQQPQEQPQAPAAAPAAGGEGSFQPTFQEPKGTSDYETVNVDLGKLDASLAKDKNMYVGPGGKGGIKGRYERFGEFAKTGQPIEMPMMALDWKGEANVGNGRHRTAWLRDQGLKTMPVRVPKEEAAQFAEKFGAPGQAPEDAIADSVDRLVSRLDAFLGGGRMTSTQGAGPMGGGGQQRARAPAGGIGGMGTWEEHKHPRGQPKNRGQFAKGQGGGGAPAQKPAQAAPAAPPAAKAPAQAPAPAQPQQGAQAPAQAAQAPVQDPEALRPIRAPGSEDRVSTRVPTAAPKKAKKGEAEPVQEVGGHERSDLAPTLASLKSTPEHFATVAKKIRDVYSKSFMPEFPPGTSDEDVVNAFVDHLESNILALHDKQDPELRERSKLWYDGANKIAHDMANEFKKPPKVMAAVIATQSPQKDWDQNVAIAHRICEIAVTNKDKKLTGQTAVRTRARMEEYAADQEKEAIKEEKKGKRDLAEKRRITAKTTLSLLDKFEGKSLQDIEDNIDDFVPPLKEDESEALTPKKRKAAERAKEKLKLAVKANYVRFVSEATHDPRVPMWNPEGTPTGENIKSPKGKESNIQWSGFGTIGNALVVLDNPDAISQKVGAMHKVRNFYNNIISPNHGDDVTIDTHAIAAALLRPLAASDPEVSEGLGGGKGSGSSAETGNEGLYSLYYEAYQRAAKARHLLPREMQSITWEAMRGLYNPEEKRSGKKKPPKEPVPGEPPPKPKKPPKTPAGPNVVDQNDEIWARHQRGEIDRATAQKAVLDRGLEKPRWSPTRGRTGAAQPAAAQ